VEYKVIDKNTKQTFACKYEGHSIQTIIENILNISKLVVNLISNLKLSIDEVAYILKDCLQAKVPLALPVSPKSVGQAQKQF
jgi:hypothetical protein